jgi:hypothetical protein
VIRDNFVRNTGDDAVATWSNGTPNARNSIVDNTVVQPNLANGIAIYGGEGATVSRNVVADTNALGGGIVVGNRFNSTPLTGSFELADTPRSGPGRSTRTGSSASARCGSTPATRRSRARRSG